MWRPNHTIGTDVNKAVSDLMAASAIIAPRAGQPVSVSWFELRTVIIKHSFPKAISASLVSQTGYLTSAKGLVCAAFVRHATRNAWYWDSSSVRLIAPWPLPMALKKANLVILPPPTNPLPRRASA